VQRFLHRRIVNRALVPFATVALALLSSRPAPAQLQWGANGAGGTGTWDATTQNWYNGSANVAWDGNTAVFGGTAGTVTLNSALSATGLTFGVTGYTVQGTGSLTLTGASPTIQNTAASVTDVITVPVSAANQLTLLSPSGATKTVFNFGSPSNDNGSGSPVNIVNSFAGGILVSGPNVRLNFNAANASGTGAGAGTISVAAASSIVTNVGSLTDNITVQIPNNIALNSGNATGTFQTAMGATKPTNAVTTFAQENVLNYSGAISGNSDVIISNAVTGGGGAGTTEFSGTAKTYTGQTVMNTSANGVLLMGASNVLPSGTALVFGVTGVTGIMNMAGTNQQVGSLSSGFTSPSSATGITNTTATLSTLTISGSASTGFAGTIGAINNGTYISATGTPGTNNLALTLAAANTGTLTLTAANTYTGNTTINGGTLALSGGGTIANSAAINVGANGTFDVTNTTGHNFTLGSGQTLAGSGQVKGGAGTVTIASGATVAPGGAGTPGILTVAGPNVTFASGGGANFSAVLNGATAGSGYSQLVVNSPGNTLSLNNANLNLSLGYTPAAGDMLFLIVNKTNNITAGTFLNASNGSPVTVGGYSATVSYFGNFNNGSGSTVTGGNDVVLYNFTPVPEPGTALAVCALGAGFAGWTRRRRDSARKADASNW
jgi:autotransporter-associated beta strand protein